jgi:hypothetical protein
MADPGPPWMMVNTCRRRWWVAATITSGFFGSMTKSVTPVCSSVSSSLVQVLPPSVVLYSPRSPPALHSGPWEATNTVSDSVGWTTILAMCSDAFRPT